MLKRVPHYLLAAWLILGGATAPLSAFADDQKEYLVKAAFIFNFVKFVEWPAQYAIANQSNIDICVLGNSPLSTTAPVFAKGSTPALKLSLVKEEHWSNAAQHCHVLFIGSSEARSLNEILQGLHGKPVLTVSDIDGFATKGGMIEFTKQDNKVKVIVNTRSASEANMRIDAQLLEVALKVIDK